MNSLLNSFAPSLDTLAGVLQRKYGVGARLPIDRYVEEYDSRQRSANQFLTKFGLFGQPNIRSQITNWFTSAGRLLQRMPALRRNIDKPSVVVLRNVSLVGTRPASCPGERSAHLVAHTLPRQASATPNHPRGHRRAHTYGGNGAYFNNYAQQTSKELYFFLYSVVCN